MVICVDSVGLAVGMSNCDLGSGHAHTSEGGRSLVHV